jgi:hypothetical protein
VHPERDHGREVERSDPRDDTEGLTQGVHVDAGGGFGTELALGRLVDATDELDRLAAAGDLAAGVVNGLAVLS